MHNQVKALILDEPTATLSSEESELLLPRCESCAAKGSPVSISPTVWRGYRVCRTRLQSCADGRIIETDAVERMDERRIVSLMVGRDVDDFYPPRTNKPGDVVFRAKRRYGLQPEFPDKKVVDNVAFDLRSGEILAVYGLVGSGRTEMAMGMIGAWKGNVECEVEVKGKEVVSRNPAQALKNGISLLPEDRKREGAIARQSVGSNISASSLPRFSKFGVINSLLEKQNYQGMIRSMSIKTPSMDALIETLSGGNQQKVILSRLISADSPVLILDEATQGSMWKQKHRSTIF